MGADSRSEEGVLRGRAREDCAGSCQTRAGEEGCTYVDTNQHTTGIGCSVPDHGTHTMLLNTNAY